MLDEVWEPSRKRARQEGDDFRREHHSYEHVSGSLPRDHLRRTPDRHIQDWDRRRSSDSHWQHSARDQYQTDPSTDDLEPSHDPSGRIIYSHHPRANGNSSAHYRPMSRSHHSRVDRTDSVQRHDSREWIPRDAVAKRGDAWPPKQQEEPAAGIGDRTWTASEGWTRENSKSAAAARANDLRSSSPPPRPHIPQAKVYNRTSHHGSTNWRDSHDDDSGFSRHHQTGGPSRVGEGWRERQVRRDRDNGRRFTDRRDKGPMPQRRPLKWGDRPNYSPPPESRAAGKRRHTSYSPSPSRKTDRSRSPARTPSRSPSHSRSRSPDRSRYRTRSPTRSRSRSRSATSRSAYSRSRSRSRSPGRRRSTATLRTRSRSPDSRWQKRNTASTTKKRKNHRGGHEYISSDKRVRRDRSTDSNRQRSRRRSVSTASTRSRSDSGESERRRTEAAKRPVHRLPESSRSKALEISPVAPQRINGFNQQKPRAPLSPTMLRAPVAIPRNSVSEALAEPPPNDSSNGPVNGLPLPTIPTGPRAMATALSLPTTHVEPPAFSAPSGKHMSPITLKQPASKAPSRTVKMFFPDDDDETIPTGTLDTGSKSNLAPPVKETSANAAPVEASRPNEFVPSKHSVTPAVASPSMSPSLSRPSAGSSPLQRTNGSTGPHQSTPYQNNKALPPSGKPVSPDVARVVRDEGLKFPATAPPPGVGSMPPPAAVRPRLDRPQEYVSPATTSKSSPIPPPENKSLKSVPPTPKRITKITSDYQIMCQVGEGTFGKVYKARLIAQSDTYVALKRIRMEGEKDGFPVTAMREIKLLQSLRHENVINLHEMMVSKGNVFMVFEYMDHDLTGVLSQTQFSFTPAHLKSLCAQMLSGLAYLHQKSVIHRDMKGSNILLNNHGELKLGDFGLARFYSKRRRSDYTNRVITLWYRPPELLLGATVYGPEVDMWSAGCIMLELFTTKPAFQGNDEIHQLDAIARIMGTPDVESWPGLIDMPWYELVKSPEPIKSHFRSSFNKYLSPAALDLAESLLTYDPNKRASAAQALKSSYFVSESPAPEKPVGLASIEGEWHEYESKREREKLRKKRKVESQQQQ
ncbi:Cdc2-related kinase, arginine/serine-rich [Ceratobasidium sp. AG-Ba]|nr:Cdc2-related kinase, arginine/serine-rich [Ceratobasidium sp. AG-Ba]